MGRGESAVWQTPESDDPELAAALSGNALGGDDKPVGDDFRLHHPPDAVDRLLKRQRATHQKCGLATTKPGSILKHHIPIKTNQWDETKPGFLEADTVAHCGASTAGMFVFTVNCVDIATGWTEQRAVWGKGERGVLEAVKAIEQALPFPLLGFDCDNGAEFLNWHLQRYLTARRRPVQYTRSRPYHKNDNAHVEGKNWTHVRQYLGYGRFDRHELTLQLNELYTAEWRLFFNFFLPSVKLKEKSRHGAKIIKKHDHPKTPLERMLQSPEVSEQTKQTLREQFQGLNPFQLQQQILEKIKRILAQVSTLPLSSGGEASLSSVTPVTLQDPAVTDIKKTKKDWII